MIPRPWRRRGYEGFRPLRRRAVPSAFRPLVDRLNAVFAETPDLPMQRACLVGRWGWDRGMTLRWRHIDRETVGPPEIIGRHPDPFGPAALDTLADIARGHVREQLLRRFLLAHDWHPAEAEPAWTRLVHEPLAAMLTLRGVRLDGLDATSLARRLELRCDGGQPITSRFDETGRIVRGMMSDGDPRVTVDTRAGPAELRIVAELPDTMLAAIAGMPLDEVVELGPGSPGTTIALARRDGAVTILQLDAPLVPLAPGPPGFDPRWISPDARGPQAPAD